MADNLKLLLVDDHPMVPGMLQPAWSSRAQGTTASDAADALLQAVDKNLAAPRFTQDAADDDLENPFFLKDATRRVKPMIDPIAPGKMAKTAPSDRVVGGNLSPINVNEAEPACSRSASVAASAPASPGRRVRRRGRRSS